MFDGVGVSVRLLVDMCGYVCVRGMFGLFGCVFVCGRVFVGCLCISGCMFVFVFVSLCA